MINILIMTDLLVYVVGLYPVSTVRHFVQNAALVFSIRALRADTGVPIWKGGYVPWSKLNYATHRGPNPLMKALGMRVRRTGWRNRT